MTLRWRALLASLACAAATAASGARADDTDAVVRGRVSLPLGGRPVDLAPLAPEGVQTVRVVLRGTLSSGLDGSTLDALSRFRSDGTRVDAEGPFVQLPAGARIVEREPDAHRYVAELPRRARMPVALNVLPLAQRHLVTRSELLRGLTGAIEVDVMGPPPPGAAIVRGGAEVARLAPPSMGLPPSAFAGIALGMPVLVGFGLVAYRRRRRGVEGHLRRAKRALSSIEREARGLGPAFDEVVTASRRLADAAAEVRYEARRLEAAERRCRQLGEGAAARRDALRVERTGAEQRLRTLTERLERTAAELAAHGAGRDGRRDLGDIARELDDELAIAVAADHEAG